MQTDNHDEESPAERVHDVPNTAPTAQSRIKCTFPGSELAKYGYPRAFDSSLKFLYRNPVQTYSCPICLEQFFTWDHDARRNHRAVMDDRFCFGVITVDGENDVDFEDECIPRWSPRMENLNASKRGRWLFMCRCHHVACVSCLQRFFSSKILQGDPYIRCFTPKKDPYKESEEPCRAPFDPEDIRTILLAEIPKRRAVLARKGPSQENLEINAYASDTSKELLNIDDEEGDTQICGTEMVKKFNEKLSSLEADLSRRIDLSKLFPIHDLNAQFWSEIKSTLRMVFTCKLCPECSFLIQKDGGCDHMLCTNCHHSFGWESASFCNHWSIKFVHKLFSLMVEALTFLLFTCFGLFPCLLVLIMKGYDLRGQYEDYWRPLLRMVSKFVVYVLLSLFMAVVAVFYFAILIVLFAYIVITRFTKKLASSCLQPVCGYNSGAGKGDETIKNVEKTLNTINGGETSSDKSDLHKDTTEVHEAKTVIDEERNA